MGLGDEASGRLGGDHPRTRSQRASGSLRHGEALDRAAEAARIDIGVLLEDLPRAEATARVDGRAMRADRRRSDRHGPPNSRPRSARWPSGPARPTRWSREATAAAARRSSPRSRRRSDRRGAGRRGRSRLDRDDRCLLAAVGRSARRDPRRIDIQAAAVAALVDQAKAGHRQGRRSKPPNALGASVGQRQTLARRPVGAQSPSRNARRSG